MTTFSSLINEIQDTTVSDSTKRQLRALTRITDLFVAGSARYSKEQIGLFDEVFRTLVAVVELKTRVKLARHLAVNSNVPATLVRAFAFDDAVAVASPILSQSAALSEADLLVNASTKSQGHLYAIAQRRTISEAITEILIERGEPKVVHSVAKILVPAFRIAALACSSCGLAMIPSLRCMLERGATFLDITF